MTRPLAHALFWLLLPTVAHAQGFDLDLDADADLSTGAESEAAAETDADAVAEADAGAVTDTGTDTGTDASTDAPSPVEAEEAPPARAVRLRSAAGIGFGTLSYERPTRTGVELLPVTPFGAVDVLVGAQAWPDAAFSLDVLLAYQTSLGLAVELDPLYALPETVGARFHRGEISIGPVVRVREGRRSLAIAVPLGFVAQFFEPSVQQFTLERFSLAGPNARVELRAWLGETVSVRAGPEIQWIVLINQGLADAGACCQGFSAGGQGAIEAALGPVLRASLAYREARAFAPAGAWRFKSVERFLTARLAGEL